MSFMQPEKVLEAGLEQCRQELVTNCTSTTSIPEETLLCLSLDSEKTASHHQCCVWDSSSGPAKLGITVAPLRAQCTPGRMHTHHMSFSARSKSQP